RRYSTVREARRGARVYNIALPGDFDTYGRLIARARSHGATVRRLVIGVCMENDLRLYGAAVTQPASGNRGWRAARQRALVPVKEWLTDHSTLYYMATYAVHGNAALERPAVRAVFVAPD